VGYKKKGSTASLKASGGFAAALVVAGYLIGGPYTTVGLGLALGECLDHELAHFLSSSRLHLCRISFY